MSKLMAALARLATDHVGDGVEPNVFFVTDRAKVVTVTRDRGVAYAHWRRLSARWPRVVCALEDRFYGVLADVGPRSDGDPTLVVRDETSVRPADVH